MFEYRVTSDGCRPAVPYDPEAEILCQLEECRENILQAIRLSTRREQFGPLLAVLMAVLEALTVVRER